MENLRTQCEDLLEDNGPVAIILKEYLRPAEGDGEPIFPPTYPMPTYRGRVHTVRDGEYRVSVELPPYRQDGQKNGKNESENVAGYNIDEFKDGTNVCEIDSPQSQANRIEPLFKTVKSGRLVPQIKIRIGQEQELNLLDAGHRAADAVVRLSSLVNDFHEAFKQVQKGNHQQLAKLAPTSILFGVWDSRGTQEKLPRIIKSEIRATNVSKLTRSAQFNPAMNFVAVGAIDDSLDKGEGEDNPLGAEGLKHVPAPRAAGGVVVRGEIKRVVRINLVALRALRAYKDGMPDPFETKKLQQYILGLALVAATSTSSLNLREGCLLCPIKDRKSVTKVLPTGDQVDFKLNSTHAEEFAEVAARDFFGSKYESKDHLDAKFESEVANEFLAMKTDDRKKIARNGPITAEAIRRFKEKGKDSLKSVSEAVKAAKRALPKKQADKSFPPELFSDISKQLESLVQDEQIDERTRDLVITLKKVIADDKDAYFTLKALDEQIKAFNKQRDSNQPTEPEEPMTV